MHPAKRQDKKWSPRAEKLVFVGYTYTAKQYRLYDPSTKCLVKSRDVVFHGDLSFFKPEAQEIFLPFTNKIEELAVTRSLSPIPSDILPPPPPPPGTGREMRRPLPAWVRKPSTISHRESSTESRWRKTPKLSLQEPLDIEMNSDLGPFWSRQEGRRRARDDRVPGEPSGSRIAEERMSEVALDRNHTREGEGEGEGEESANLIVGYALMVVNGPKSIEEALNGTHRKEWTNAINSELQCLEGQDTWSVVSTSNDTNGNLLTISSRIVLQEKLGEDGQISPYKASVVAHGFRQRPGIDFVETYSPTISFPPIRMVQLKAAVQDNEIVQLDILTAFLESEIEELIYLQLPKEFGVLSERKIVLKDVYTGDKSGTRTANVVVQLKTSLYGLKQAGCNWYNMFESHLKDELVMKSSKHEAGFYTTECRATIIVWVDDMLLIGTKMEVRWMKSAISKRFKTKNLGNVEFFLSMLVEQDRDKKVIYLSEGAYLTSVLKRFQMENCKGCPTPMDPKCKLHNRLDQGEEADKTQYQEAVGCLTYTAITTRPDIAYASSIVVHFSSNLWIAHSTAVKRILRYLRHTQHLHLRLGRRTDWLIGEVRSLSGNAPFVA